MKKVFKSRMFIVIITMIICISGTLYATNIYQASDVIYNGSDGTSMNVNDALNELYKTKDIFNDSLVEVVNNEIPEGVNTAYVIVHTLTSYEPKSVSIIGDIIKSEEELENMQLVKAGAANSLIRFYRLQLTGENGIISVNLSGGVLGLPKAFMLLI